MRLRWIALGVAVLLLGGVAAALVLAQRMIAANRDRIVAAAEAGLGRPVEVEGIDVRLLGRPGVRLTQVAIGEDPAFGSDPFVQARSATVVPRLWPLLEGRIEIARIELDRPRVRLVRGADGAFNYAGIARRSEAAATGAPAPAPAAGGSAAGARDLAVAVAVFDIHDGEVTFLDQSVSPPSSIALTQIALSASDLALDQPTRFSLRAAYDASAPNVELAGALGPVASAEGVPFELHGTVGPLPRLLPAVLENLEIRGRARPSTVDVEHLSFDAFGGSVAGSASLPLVQRGAFSLGARAQGVAVQQLLPVLAPRLDRTIEGVATAEVDVLGIGSDPAMLRQSVRGTVSLEVEDGALRDLNLLGAVVDRLTSMPGLSKLVSRGVKPKYADVLNRTDTRFSSLKLHLRLVDGGLDVESLRLDGEDFGASATGRVTPPDQADLRGEVVLSKRLSAEVAADVGEARLLYDDDDQISLPFVYRGVIGKTKPEADLERLGNSVLQGRGRDLVDALLKGGSEGKGAVHSLGRSLEKLFGR